MLFGGRGSGHPARLHSATTSSRATTATTLLRGSAGADRLLGGSEDDRLAGGPDNDLLRGGEDVDAMKGKGGIDVIQAKDGFTDRKINCGPGPNAPEFAKRDKRLDPRAEELLARLPATVSRVGVPERIHRPARRREPTNGLGDGGTDLHEWALAARTSAARSQETSVPRRSVNGEVGTISMSIREPSSLGRGTFEPAAVRSGDHHDGAPIVIVARGEPGVDVSQWPLATDVDVFARASMQQSVGDHPARRGWSIGAVIARRALAAGAVERTRARHVAPGSLRPSRGGCCEGCTRHGDDC